MMMFMLLLMCSFELLLLLSANWKHFASTTIFCAIFQSHYTCTLLYYLISVVTMLKVMTMLELMTMRFKVMTVMAMVMFFHMMWCTDMHWNDFLDWCWDFLDDREFHLSVYWIRLVNWHLSEKSSSRIILSSYCRPKYYSFIHSFSM